MKRESQANAMV